VLLHGAVAGGPAQDSLRIAGGVAMWRPLPIYLMEGGNDSLGLLCDLAARCISERKTLIRLSRLPFLRQRHVQPWWMPRWN